MRRSGIAVLFACLLGALIYYLPLDTSRPAFSFAWASGDNSPEPSAYNVLIRRLYLDMKFYFTNGTGLSIPNIYPPLLDQGPNTYPPLPAYHGEIDATSLAAIGVRLYPYIAENPGAAVASMELSENRSVSAALISGGVTTDMGIHNSLNLRGDIWFNETLMTTGESGTYCDGQITRYFDPESVGLRGAVWNITTDELCQMLPATGTATIQFHGSVGIDVNYNITINDELKTGHELLSWNGILGTYQLSTDQGKIISVKYDFISVFLFLKIEK
jgi:hypothetical protein